MRRGVGMEQGSIFVNNRTQAIRLPAEQRFPDDVKRVFVRSLGRDRVLSPVDCVWDSFFHAEQGVTEDFMTERASQQQPERESF